ncbi:MAG TPA: Gfo/Idh/MocA family oxidoreductase [Candidatus Acidoferrum sp.]|nr:Gfo/Idh/MocA family oxidoreductase [Candidatus Acidoferrum sp.]
MKIRYGMVGGGDGSFIGSVHRSAAALDGDYELVCGALSSDATRARQSGLKLGLAAERCYDDYATMMQQEAQLPAEQRMQCVVIVTPNHLHLPVAKAALQHGFHVISDKPATLNLAECRELAQVLRDSGLLYGLTHPYIAYPMVQEARALIMAGRIGKVHKVIAEYIQGWLSTPIEHSGNKQASWRTDPARSGASNCMGDIGVHAFNLAEFISGLSVTQLRGELNRVVVGRELDDDGTVTLRFDNGAYGVLLASQICTGEENGIRLRVFGDKGSVDWRQLEPNTLWLRQTGKPTEQFRTGTPYLGPEAQRYTRIPAGHPEGYVEAFANLYRSFAAQIRALQRGGHSEMQAAPGIVAALRGMAFIETAVNSSNLGGAWLPFPAV